jgi:outer membrane biosynthesis protein TonB
VCPVNTSAPVEPQGVQMSHSPAPLRKRGASFLLAVTSSILVTTLTGIDAAVAAPIANCDGTCVQPYPPPLLPLPPIPILCQLLPPILAPCRPPKPPATTPPRPPKPTTTTTPPPPPAITSPPPAPVVVQPAAPVPAAPPRRQEVRRPATTTPSTRPPTTRPTSGTPATTTAVTTTRAQVRQVAVPPAPLPHPTESVQEQRRWALVVLIMTVGAAVVTGAAKRRMR